MDLEKQKQLLKQYFSDKGFYEGDTEIQRIEQLLRIENLQKEQAEELYRLLRSESANQSLQELAEYADEDNNPLAEYSTSQLKSELRRRKRWKS